MKSAYTSPIFWTQVMDRALRTGAQFGLAFLLAVFGESAQTGFDGALIDFLALAGWMLAGVIISVLNSLAFPKKVAGFIEPDDQDRIIPDRTVTEIEDQHPNNAKTRRAE